MHCPCGKQYQSHFTFKLFETTTFSHTNVHKYFLSRDAIEIITMAGDFWGLLIHESKSIILESNVEHYFSAKWVLANQAASGGREKGEAAQCHRGIALRLVSAQRHKMQCNSAERPRSPALTARNYFPQTSQSKPSSCGWLSCRGSFICQSIVG